MEVAYGQEFLGSEDLADGNYEAEITAGPDDADLVQCFFASLRAEDQRMVSHGHFRFGSPSREGEMGEMGVSVPEDVQYVVCEAYFFNGQVPPERFEDESESGSASVSVLGLDLFG